MLDTVHPFGPSFPPGGLALVIASNGGIGSAVARQLHQSRAFAAVIGTGREGPDGVDLTDEASISALAARIKGDGRDLRLVFDASGYLHGDQGGPEKSWSAIDPNAMAHQFTINAIGPALLIKHLAPLLPREGKAVFATISAKVGSIADNRLGGWYGYRAAKAALNQIVKSASIELARKRPEAICVALHPGTVATRLSDPFAKAGVRLHTPDEAAAQLLTVLENVAPADTGALLAYDGARLPY